MCWLIQRLSELRLDSDVLKGSEAAIAQLEMYRENKPVLSKSRSMQKDRTLNPASFELTGL